MNPQHIKNIGMNRRASEVNKIQAGKIEHVFYVQLGQRGLLHEIIRAC